MGAIYKRRLIRTEFRMAISLTESAAERVRNYLDNRGSGIGLRVGVKKTGCNGFAYVINYAEKIDAADVVFEDFGIKVFVDKDSLALIDGTVVDFVKEVQVMASPLCPPNRPTPEQACRCNTFP